MVSGPCYSPISKAGQTRLETITALSACEYTLASALTTAETYLEWRTRSLVYGGTPTSFQELVRLCYRGCLPADMFNAVANELHHPLRIHDGKPPVLVKVDRTDHKPSAPPIGLPSTKSPNRVRNDVDRLILLRVR